MTERPSIGRVKSCKEGRRDLGPVMRSSDLLQLSLRKLLVIHDFIAVKQLVMVETVAGVRVLEER